MRERVAAGQWGVAGAAATASATSAAGGIGPHKLPPNPSNTLCRPQQRRQQQRAAEHAAAQQDVQGLQQAVLGTAAGGVASADDEPHQQRQPLGEADACCVSALTLQTLLPSSASQQRLHSQAPLLQPSSPPIQRANTWAPSTSGGLVSQTSALSAYIAGMQQQEEGGGDGGSGMLQRQLTNLQASTSGGGGDAAGGSSGWFMGAPMQPHGKRQATMWGGRREAYVLSKWLEVRVQMGEACVRLLWTVSMEARTQPSCAHAPPPPLQVETQRFNATYARKDERTPLVDFLLLAAAKGKAIYSQAYAELARQVGRCGVCWRAFLGGGGKGTQGASAQAAPPCCCCR